MPGQCVDQCLAMSGIVEHHDGMFATSLAVGTEQHTQLAQQCVGRWQGITGGASRTRRGTLTATGADMSVDGHVITGGSDCTSRTKIETAVAADDPGARVCAKVFAEGYVARLVERSGQVACLQYDTQNRCGIARVSSKIAIAKITGRKKRWTARQIDKNITAGYCAVAAMPELEGCTRGRIGCCVIVDSDLKSAEITFGGADRALHNRKLSYAWRVEPGVWSDQNGDVELVFEQVRCFDDLLIPAVKESDPLACQWHKGNIRRWLRSCCN